MKTIKPIRYVSEFTTEDTVAIFRDKINCKDCKFSMTWKGKTNSLVRGFYHRSYCQLVYVFPKDLNKIIQVRNLRKTIEKLHDPRFSSDSVVPDVIKVHPDNPKLFTLNCILVKYLDMCPLDRLRRGEEISKEMISLLKDWHIKTGQWQKNPIF